MQQKRTLLTLQFLKKSYLEFLKFSVKRVLFVPGYLFNKVNRSIIQKPDAGVTES